MGLLGLSEQAAEPRPESTSSDVKEGWGRGGVYKRGQGTPIRVAALVGLGLLWLSGCRWLYLLPPSTSAWYRQIVVTGANVLLVALVIVAAWSIYQKWVARREDHELLRWAGMTGAIVLVAIAAKLLMNAASASLSPALTRSLIGKSLPISWGMAICSVAFLYGLWSLCHLIVNQPRRVDFLIETETELRKMAWPTRREYLGASAVVIIIVAFISLYLTAVDLILNRVMLWLQIGF
jgi:preprotein translocase SecE subunit